MSQKIKPVAIKEGYLTRSGNIMTLVPESHFLYGSRLIWAFVDPSGKIVGYPEDDPTQDVPEYEYIQQEALKIQFPKPLWLDQPRNTSRKFWGWKILDIITNSDGTEDTYVFVRRRATIQENRLKLSAPSYCTLTLKNTDNSRSWDFCELTGNSVSRPEELAGIHLLDTEEKFVIKVWDYDNWGTREILLQELGPYVTRPQSSLPEIYTQARTKKQITKALSKCGIFRSNFKERRKRN